MTAITRNSIDIAVPAAARGASLISLTGLRIYATLLTLIGAALAVGGLYLSWLGGSHYYVLCGIAVLTSGVLLWMRRRLGADIYGIMLLSTLVWALWESGYYGWALLPRLGGPAVLGLVLLIPATRRMLIPYRPERRILGGIYALIAALAVGAGLHILARGAPPVDPIYQNGMITTGASRPVKHAAGDDGDWRMWGNDAGGSRFSALDQITRSNVGLLAHAWTFRVGETNGLSVTPIKVGRTLYFCNSHNKVFALDAETGRLRWMYNPHIVPNGSPSPQCRGVTYFRSQGVQGECGERILTNTLDARLIALDARTGRPCRGFGHNGQVSLLTGMGKFPRGYYYVTSAPTIVRGKIVLGGAVADNQYWGEPSGVIRAFDVITGKLAWAFDLGRPDRTSEPPPGETYTHSTPNSWAPMSADEALGLVYAPTGNSTPDYFGGQRRPFDDKYSSSVVAIDAETGKSRWVFQTVHHDLWDYDVASQPTLVDLPGVGGPIRALVQPTKRGDLFVLDRVTGRPIRRVVELPAPQGGAGSEERLSPTQPYSIGMPSFRGSDFVESDMWGLTPLDQLWCRIKFREARYEGPFTPPGLTPAISLPGFMGGMEWGGVALDQDRGIAIVNSAKVGVYTRLLPRAEADGRGLKPFGANEAATADLVRFTPGWQTPYGGNTAPFLTALGVPCNQPPYGQLSAVDLMSGKLIWTQTFGTARDSGPKGIPLMLPIPLGTPNIGGAVVTRGGLFFIGAAQDRYLRAYETTTGRLLWKARLPAGGQATPITYRSSDSGRQFVLIAAGGHNSMKTKKGDYVIAFAVPKGGVR